MKYKFRFNRNEVAGAFGDIGTDFPLIVGMVLAAGLDAASVLVMYGLMQIMTGLIYQRPMPVQPLKAVAAIVITQKLTGPTLYGGGLAIALIMLLLTLTGSLEWLARNVPKCVVRGIQAGLGMSLALLALKDYVGRDGVNGYFLAAASFLLILWLLPNKRFPAALAVIGLGFVYAFIFKVHLLDIKTGIAFHSPIFYVPTSRDILSGFLLLAIPQIPLSLGNSILATSQVNQDLFPQKPLSIRKIGFTYSLMNCISPLFGGVPVCHGSGGMMGHYTFGARTGGSILIYGAMYLFFGLFLSQVFSTVIKCFPMPILGIILFVEALALMTLIKDLDNKKDLWIAMMVALMSCALPNGFFIGLVAGVFVHRLNFYRE
ncbi:MAG: putative sulfate/molybdate transporter [Candidatus Omnitrophica bacterium]|nr:putative sulfate/molybdate transporter [Candidatus Omnitrophota bacterium]